MTSYAYPTLLLYDMHFLFGQGLCSAQLAALYSMALLHMLHLQATWGLPSQLKPQLLQE